MTSNIPTNANTNSSLLHKSTCPRRFTLSFEIYIRNNREFIPNFGERYRNGETISIAFVESTINQVVSKRFVKKQSMQWTLRGAHLLLQTRTKVLNEELDEVFRRWYPKFRPRPQPIETKRKAA